MAKQYGIIRAKKPEFPPVDLLEVPHQRDSLIVCYPAFGPDYFLNNVRKMQESYSHPITGERITFRKPTTSESISASAYDFEKLAKPQIFDPRWLQLGHIVKTSEGVWANPPIDKKGNPITDESTLKKLLNGAEKINGIYLYDKNDFGFAPYGTFEQGEQESGKFAEGGLARLLEHTEKESALNLKKISSEEFYPRGIYVWGFDKVEEPVLRVVALGSRRYAGAGRLGVGGDWSDDDGCAFGVFVGGADAQKF